MKRREQLPLHVFPKINADTGVRWSLADQGKAALNEICDTLNSDNRREVRFHLRAWVDAWQAAGTSLKKLFGSLADPQRTALTVAMRTMWNPTDGGQAEILFVPDYPALEDLLGKERVWHDGPDGKPKITPETEALTLFHLLTVVPGCEKIAGPCARCKNYYIKKRASQKVYCSRRCGQAATAVARTTVRLKDEREEKLKRARTAVKEWNALKIRTSLEWKDWLSKREPDITEKFVTRWANKGELPQPKRERK